MVEKEIEVFIECLENYFLKRSDEQVIVETPYLTENISKDLLEFTGVISISGSYKGNIYFTAPNEFLKKLINAHGQNDFSEQLMEDAIGEITNTLSGNSRKSLGSHFVISVPTILHENVHPILIAKGARSYVVPLKWFDYSAAMVVSVVKA